MISLFSTLRIVTLSLCVVTALSANRSQAAIGAQPSDLYQQLCELNQNWSGRTPNWDALPDKVLIESDTALIETHLRLVIDQLRNADVNSLTEPQRAQRSQLIQKLQDYMLAGRFPKNIFVAGRRPVFIDPWGTHCAVGHLIAVSGHPELAAQINEQHQLDYLSDIQTPGLTSWQQASGLTLDELALIQPSYHYIEVHYPAEIEDLILGDSTAIRELMDEQPSIVHARCGGKTLLHFAAAAGDLELVQLLIERGADLHAISELGREPVPSKPSDDRIKVGVSSSSTLINVRWNQKTLAQQGKRFGIGIRGRALSTPEGSFIAGILKDMHYGVENKNATEFALGEPFRPIISKREIGESMQDLMSRRAAVVEWLREQGLTDT